MAYEEAVAERLRRMLKRRKGISEKKMFGGIAFLLHGHMVVGVLGDEIVLRLGNDGAAEALDEPHTRPMDFTGKPIKSMLYVAPDGFRTEDDLRGWVERALRFAKTLPPK